MPLTVAVTGPTGEIGISAVDALVADTDVVVHLAYLIMGLARGEPPHQPDRHPQRLRGNAQRGPRPSRLVYTSSVAAYGYHPDNPVPLTEDRLPLLPAAAEWIHAGRSSVVMDTSRAKGILGWRPQHTSRETLDALAASL